MIITNCSNNEKLRIDPVITPDGLIVGASITLTDFATNTGVCEAFLPEELRYIINALTPFAATEKE